MSWDKKVYLSRCPFVLGQKSFLFPLSLCPRTRAAAKILRQTPLSRMIGKKKSQKKSNIVLLSLCPWIFQDGTGCQNPVQARFVAKCQNPVPACSVARFWACPVVPLSRDNKGTSVLLSHGPRKSRPIGNPDSRLTIWEFESSKKHKCFTLSCQDT